MKTLLQAFSDKLLEIVYTIGMFVLAAVILAVTLAAFVFFPGILLIVMIIAAFR